MEAKNTKIIVTTDFSPESIRAFDWARKQLHSKEDKIILLTVLEDIALTSVQFEFGLMLVDSTELMNETEKESRVRLEQLLESHFPSGQAEARIVRAFKPVHAEIVDFARQENADLLVMATHGRTGLSHLILGSVVENVVRHAPCPVLVIPSA